MKFKISHITLVGSVFLASNIFYSNSYGSLAMNSKDTWLKSGISNEILSTYYLRVSQHADFLRYLEKNGISENEYKAYSELAKKYEDSELSKIDSLLNGMYIYDEVIYTNPVMKNLYKVNFDDIGVDANKVWKGMKRESIYDMDWVQKLYEESVSNYADMDEIFKYKFNVDASEINKKDMKTIDNLKYALVSGYLGRDLSKGERGIVERGDAYKLFNISDNEKKAYDKYIVIQKKFKKYEESYIRTRLVHANVRNVINKECGVDIFGVLDDKTLEQVYYSSVVYLNYDESMAKKKFMNILKIRDYLDSEEKDYGDKPIGDDVVGVVPGKPGADSESIGGDGITDKDYDYIEENEKFSEKDDEIEVIIDDNRTAQYYINMNAVLEEYDKKEIKKALVVDVKGKEIYTSIKSKDGVIDYMDVRNLLTQTLGVVEGDIIYGENRLMLFINDNVAVLNNKECSIQELNNQLKVLKIKIKEISVKDLRNKVNKK